MAAPPPEPSSGPTASTSSSPTTAKPIHSLVLDTGPLIKNDPPASVLLARAEMLYTLPCIIPEIRDPATRSRVETTLLPFVTLRSPRPESLRFVQGFARRTGDLAVLSRPDLEVLALGYELECERNGGDWRLRSTPGQKGLNGRPGKADDAASSLQEPNDAEAETVSDETAQQADHQDAPDAHDTPKPATQEPQPLERSMQQLELAETGAQPLEMASGEKPDETTRTQEEADEESDDEGGWITPSNVKKQQAKDAGAATPSQVPQKTLQAAILTSDYAMQNVALRMNLNLVTPSLARITQVKNWVLRCHGCFSITKDMNKQFCPSCGQPTLMRASCSTDQHGNFRVHLKKNFQWNNRGNVYSVPRPVHGSANGRLAPNAGGKNGWGQGLMLAEDQKEYARASEEQRRARKKDLMDDDYLPGILSGDRSGGSGGRIRVGAGRNVNSKRKH
ncbi:nin one binding (NOB1) zn-ribbon like domain-containing protein [Hirsutella rhossiliensis]|uniref:20S-pre-rRNA D-site endonuclease NOB1 n=1 Tax=Hirsutella rhossiliensis TaxID=111463 RepID=A0A9P8N899_9HYPO|nr:nin one binding (NOB1) zn-ribbon like domain-containing protein [Hirsutella rhossiliensis]KAH0967811.1 nin one binding (NOB1) zn-ribbon like domain-containing protein [Hirsutella rhossiliensis]